MVTNFRLFLDLFGNLEWPLFDGTQVSRPDYQEERLGALTLETSGGDIYRDRDRMARARDNAGELARILFHSRALASYRVFLFVAHGPWQDDNRIVRYKKLWRGFNEEWGAATFPSKSAEIEFRSDRGIRYAGLLEVSEDNIATAAEIVRGSPGVSRALIVSERLVLASDTDIRNISRSAFTLRKGIPDTHVNWANLSAALCPQGDVVCRIVEEHAEPIVETQLFSTETLTSYLAQEIEIQGSSSI